MNTTDNYPIRVLMLFTILNRGGAESMVMNYYRAIDRSKVQFDFVVHREEKGDYEDEITALDDRIYRMTPLRPTPWENTPNRFPHFSMSIPNTASSMVNAPSRVIISIKKPPVEAFPSLSPMPTTAM